MAKPLVLLVGHGAPPRDLPASLVSQLKRLEAERRRSGAPLSDEERWLDETLRRHPRTVDNDPYFHGLSELAGALRALVAPAELRLAFNEFCAPSLDEALDEAIADGAAPIWVVSTMWTRGGVHADEEIPEALAAARSRHPAADVRYAWPFDAAAVAAFLRAHLRAHGLPDAVGAGDA